MYSQNHKRTTKEFRPIFEGGVLYRFSEFYTKVMGWQKVLCFQILLYNFIMSVLWLYMREGVFDFEDAHRKPCLPLIVWWSDAKADDFLNRQKNKTAPHSSLGTETSLENPEHTANSYALRKRSKALEDATPLLLCHSRAASCEETQLPLLCVVSNHICHEQTCSPQGIYTAWLVSGGQGCHWPLTRKMTLNGLTLF